MFTITLNGILVFIDPHSIYTLDQQIAMQSPLDINVSKNTRKKMNAYEKYCFEKS